MNNSVNPFFEYVSNNKLNLAANIDLKTYTVKIQNKVKQQNQQAFPISLGNSETKVDPRKNIRNNQNKITQQRIKNQRQRNMELREKRSRSRQNKQRQTQNNNKQKKEEHFHKTKLCPLYEKGLCKNGNHCTFAHGQNEIRGLPNFIKTRICIAFKNGQCKKSSKQCKYAHGEEQLRSLRHGGFEQPPKPDRKYRDYDQKYRRDSESFNRKQKHHKKSISRDISDQRQRHRKSDKRNEKRNDKRNDSQENNFYKKSIPINKEYEKYLYGSTPEFNNSAYLVPHVYPSTFEPSNNYDVYPGITQKLNSNSSVPIMDNPNLKEFVPAPYGFGRIQETPKYETRNNFSKQIFSQDRPYPQNSTYPTQPIYNSYGSSYLPHEESHLYQNFSKNDQKSKFNNSYMADSGQKFFTQPTPPLAFSQPYYYPPDKSHAEIYLTPNNDKYQPFYGVNENQYKKTDNFLNKNSYTPALYPALDNNRYPGFQAGGKKNFTSYSNNFSSR